jgi:broad specificity polyphosphatase/5'/3'-nucleotidase SurE
MDAALSNHRAIALSYGIFERPISDALLKAANQLSVKIIQELWKTGFGQPGDPNYPDLYSVNIPVSGQFLSSFCFTFFFGVRIT